MAPLVHGIDVVDISRIRRLLESHGEHFCARVFTESERRYADGGGAGRTERYAARFAAKEAVFKALGCGWAGGTSWTDVSVSHQPGGAPVLTLSGQSAAHADALGISKWVISLSHAGDIAMASVIGTSADPEVS